MDLHGGGTATEVEEVRMMVMNLVLVVVLVRICKNMLAYMLSDGIS